MHPSSQSGSAEPLVIAPGMVCDGASWAPQIAALEPDVLCHVADYGLARSIRAMAEVTLEQAPPRFALAGHSMGGRVALEICRLAPERVTRLALLSSECRPCPEGKAGEAETRGRLAMLDLARRDGMREMARRWLPKLLAARHLERRDLARSIEEMIAGHSVEQLEAHIAAGGSRPDHFPVLSNIRCPTLLIAGRHDAVRPAALLEEMAPHLHDARLIILEDVGHMPMLERPEPVNAAFVSWMTAPPS